MKGSLPPMIMNLVLQRQPMAVHYLKQSVMEHVKKQKTVYRSRFSFKTCGTTTSEQKTGDPISEPNKDSDSSIESLDFGNDALTSFVFVNTLTRQYEEPVGISEFVGYPAVSGKQRQQSQRRHRCCGRAVEDVSLEAGGNEPLLFNSGVCEDCATSGGSHRNSFNSGGRTKHTCT